MSKEDILLPLEMEKLEIEPVKVGVIKNTENPFIISQVKKKFFSQKLMRYSKCICASQKRDITIPIYKRKNNRILKEPTLKLLQIGHDNASHAALTRLRDGCIQSTTPSLSGCDNICSNLQSDALTLRTLVNDYNQLRISADSNVHIVGVKEEAISESRWWKQSTSQMFQNKESHVDKGKAGPSCSQEARNPPCDVTIDELASYFETLVHIPKKMSSMAEMMYI